MGLASVRYRRHTSRELGEEAARTARVELRPDEAKPEDIVISGPCPCCGHETTFVEPVFVLRGIEGSVAAREASNALRDALEAAGKNLTARDVEVICHCGSAHPGAPNEAAGCGRSWVLHIEWGVP